MLSAIAHPELETAFAARAALDALPEEDQKRYWDVILSRLPAHVRRRLEPTMVKADEPMGEFAHTFYAQGRGWAAKRGLLRAIVALVEARTPGLRDETLERLRGQPEARLVQIILELDKVHDEDGVRAVLDRHS